MSCSQSFLAKSARHFPWVQRQIQLSSPMPLKEKMFKLWRTDLNITHIHVDKHENILRQVSKLPRAPPDVRKKQKQSHTDVREETSLLHKQPSGAPNAATLTNAHQSLYINGANCCSNAYADVFMSSVQTFRVSTWMQWNGGKACFLMHFMRNVWRGSQKERK